MSSDDPEHEFHPSGSVPVEEAQRLPGCGMAVYAVLLMGFLAAGVTGITLATLHMLQTGEEAAPSKLRAGNQVGVWQMAPMREAKLVEVDEVPLAWHGETFSQDGSIACALMKDRLVRVENGKGYTLRYGDIAALALEGSNEGTSTVRASGVDPSGQPVEIGCVFGPFEGSTRMLAQLEVERDRAQAR